MRSLNEGMLMSPDRGTPVWLRVGKVFDGERVLPWGETDVVFDAQTIRHVGSAGALPARALARPGQAAPDATLPDHTLLPGLIESHAHIFLKGGELSMEHRKSGQALPGSVLIDKGRERLHTLLELGIMAMRDAGDRHGVGLALSAERRSAGLPRVCYLDSPGAAIHRRGRYGAFMSGALEEHSSAEDCVQARVSEGADRIKLIVSGIIDFKTGIVNSPPQLDIETVSRLSGAARRHGKQCFAHASGADGITNAVRGGVDTIEHGYFITRELLAEMRDGNQAWVPTFAPLQKQVDHAEILNWDGETVGRLRAILEGHERALAEASSLGVQVIAGSDAGSFGVAHGVDFIYELELMERAGLSSELVLRSATGSPAARLGFPESIGRIQTNAKPRMILTRHDPSIAVSHLRREKWCLFDGRALHVDPGKLETRHL